MHLVRPRRIDYIMVRGHGPSLDVLSCDLAFSEPLKA
jgi:hypothetical protein